MLLPSRIAFAVIVLGGCVLSCSAQVPAGGAVVTPRQVFIVRHTEREYEGEDAPLTVQGLARAQALAATLRDAGITAIITTQWKRTKDTAKPLAEILRISPEVVPVSEGKGGDNARATADAVRRHKDGNVLVVGHITVTGVIAALSGPRLPTICDNVFSDLFQLTPVFGDQGLVHLHYGARENISPDCRLTAPTRGRRD